MHLMNEIRDHWLGKSLSSSGIVLIFRGNRRRRISKGGNGAILCSKPLHGRFR
jgi:hypothetical protein